MRTIADCIAKFPAPKFPGPGPRLPTGANFCGFPAPELDFDDELAIGNIHHTVRVPRRAIERLREIMGKK